MMTSSMWKKQRALDEGLIMNSTKAGQHVINGVRRPQLNVLPATRSNPQGVGMVQTQPKVNPLTALTTKGQPAMAQNLMRQASGVRVNRTGVSQVGRWVTIQDCVKQNGHKPGQE